MKKHKLIIAVISAFAVLLAPFGVLAADTLEVSTDVFSGKVTVTATFSECPNEPVTLQLVPEDSDIVAMSDIAYALSQLSYANQMMSDSDGKAVFEFPFTGTSGDYIVRTLSMETAGLALQKTIRFINLDELKKAWDNLTSDPESNFGLILDAGKCADELILSMKNDDALMTRISSYDSLGELNSINIKALFAKIKTDCESIVTFRKTVDIIKNADNVSQIKAALSNQANIAALGISDLSVRYNALKNTRPVDEALIGKSYTSAEDFRADFLNFLILAESDGGSSQGSSSSNGSSSAGSSAGKGTSSLGTSINVQPAVSVQPAVNELPFTDINGVAWAKDAIADLYVKKIINGKTASSFAPNDYILREEFVKMTAMLLGLNTSVSDTAFSDVDVSAWYAPYVAAAVKAGLVNGYSDSVFGIGDYITRQDVAVILSRVADIPDGGASVEFTDKSDISEYAADAVAKLSANGIINGSGGAFMPKNYSTRAETACMIYRLAAMIKEGV